MISPEPLEQLHDDNARLRGLLAECHRELAKQRKLTSSYRESAAQAEARMENAFTQLARVRGSLVWRITEPLRLLAQKFRS